jgi:ABC-type phosphate transport system substrate-binding protein
MLRDLGGYSDAELDQVQDAILTHSTGYWYFRASVDEAAGREGAWEAVYPEPRTAIAKYAHDADLVSQFVPETVIPDGSKWRGLARKRWGASTAREEAQVVHYVFARMLAEARTPAGKALALEKWTIIEPPLLAAMQLAPGQDPVQAYGVPAAFRKKGASMSTTAETLTYDCATTIGNGIVQPAAAVFEKKTGVKFARIGTSGAGKGLKAALAGEVSLAGVSRKLTPEEASGVYVETIGYDAIGIFVNEKNPVKALSSAQLEAIFSGRARSWKELGGGDLPIVACSEALKGGRATVDTFKQMILGGGEFGPVTEQDDARDCLQIVAREPGAISYASMGYVIAGTRSVPLDGVSPKPADIRAGAYKLSRPLNLVARKRPRKHLTLVTKSNAQRHGLVLWDEVFFEVAKGYPDVQIDRELVDAVTTRMVLKPRTLDVLVATNLHADILSDLAAALSGSLGIGPTANLNPERTFPSMFEPIHGSAFDIAGKGVANPIATFWTAAMMLEHLGEVAAAARLMKAVEATTATKVRTPDLGGTATTRDVTRAVCEAVTRRD